MLGGDQRISIEKTFSKSERYTQAYSEAQAKRIFAEKFAKKLDLMREGIFLYAKVRLVNRA